MSLGKIYYCSECHSISDEISDIFLVSDHDQRSFCCEKCVEKHFMPLSEFYEAYEIKMREKHHLLSEEYSHIKENQDFIEACLLSPDSITFSENDLHQRIYCYHKKIDYKCESYTFILVLLRFEYRPTYIFLVTATQSDELIEEFKFTESDDLKLFYQNKLALPAPEDEESTQLELIERKKSLFLSELLMHYKESDIAIENYVYYENYVNETIETPDESYLWSDAEGDQVLIYIKSFSKDGTSFFMFSFCLLHSLDDLENEQTVIPIFSFPTVDGELYEKMKKGEKVAGHQFSN